MVGDGTMLPGVVTGAWWLVSLIANMSYFLAVKKGEMMQ
jgi:hypothetical protein